MSEGQAENKPTPFTPISAKRLIQVLLLGAVVGAIVWVLAFLIDTYIVEAVICHGSVLGGCTVGRSYAEAVATIAGAGIGLFGLVRLQMFRPLLVVLAALVSLWGLLGTITSLPWYGIGVSSALLYGFAYAMYVWIARVRSFILVLILLVIMMTAVRLLLNA
jgi:hypothetical protein